MPPRRATKIEIPFPLRGIKENFPYSRPQPNTYIRGNNVRAFDSLEDRVRGGQRAGVSKYIEDAINSTIFIQALAQGTLVTHPNAITVDELLATHNYNSDTVGVATDIGISVNHTYGEAAVGTWPSGTWGFPSPNGYSFFGITVSGGTVGTVFDLANTDYARLDRNQLAVLPFSSLNEGGSGEHRLFTDPTILETDVLTATGLDATDTAAYFTGVYFIATSLTTAAATHEYFAVLHRRTPGVATTQDIILTNEDGTIIATSSALGTLDASVHKLQVRWNGDAGFGNVFIQAFWDNSLVMSTTQTTTVGAVDGFLRKNHMGLMQGRTRSANTWSNNANFGGMDNSRIFTGSPIATARERTLVAVTGGDVYSGSRVEGLTLASSGTDALDDQVRHIGVQFAFGEMFLTDSETYKVLSVPANVVSDWDGTRNSVALPGGNGSDGPADGAARCNIIALWEGRIALAGLRGQADNVFFSAIGDPRNWDRADAAFEDAFDLTSSSILGTAGDTITALITHRLGRLLIGGASSLHVFEVVGGFQFRLRELSGDVGIVGPRAWAVAPDSNTYVLSRDGLYVIAPNEFDVDKTNKVSAGALDTTFRNINFNENQAILGWDVDRDGLDIFIVPTSGAAASTHYFWDRRTQGFDPASFDDTDIGPTALLNFVADNTGDRAILLGGWDSIIRKWDRTVKDDDGTAIASEVLLGPILSPFPGREFMVTSLEAVLDEQSDDVSYEVIVADTVEAASVVGATPSFTGTWVAGRNASVRNRARGSAAFIRLHNSALTKTWALESLTATIAEAGMTRPR